MIGLLYAIANITGGILLGLATLDKWDGNSNFFKKAAAVLSPFQTLIGGALIVLAILKGWKAPLYNIASILGGILLLAHVVGTAPLFGDTLKKISNKLMPFKAIIGVIILIVGIISIL